MTVNVQRNITSRDETGGPSPSWGGSPDPNAPRRDEVTEGAERLSLPSLRPRPPTRSVRRPTGNPIGAGGACGYSMRRRPHPRERVRAPCVHVPSRRPRTTHRGDSLHAATTARSSAPTAAARRRSCATWLLLVAVRSAAHDRPQLRRLWAERLDVPGLTHWNMWRRLERQGGSAGGACKQACAVLPVAGSTDEAHAY